MSSLTVSNILAAASEYLSEGGYSRVPDETLKNWPLTQSRLFEDPYSVAAVVVYETWSELVEKWTQAQAGLIELMSRFVKKPEAKAWEGYLILFTPGVPSSNELADLHGIRYNTSRVRKLVATGDELRTLEDVKRALFPLLPVAEQFDHQDSTSVLDLLPRLLAEKGIPVEVTEALLTAFRENKALVKQIHEIRTAS